MDWSSVITALLTNIVIIAALFGIVRFLGKKWIGTRIEESVKHEYAKKLEEHKTQLQEQVNRSVEEMKAEFHEAVDQKVTDKVLYANFLETLPSSGSIEFLKTFDMGFGSFETECLSQLKNFYYTWNKPEYEFLDAELEHKRKALRGAISKYLDSYSENVFCTKTDTKRAYVLPEWKETQPEVYRQVVDELNSLADEVVKAHEDLVRNARAKLKC